MPTARIKCLLPILQRNPEVGARAVVDLIPALRNLRAVPLPRPRLAGLSIIRAIHPGTGPGPWHSGRALRAGPARRIRNPDQLATPAANTSQRRGKFTLVDVASDQTLANLLASPKLQELQRKGKFVGFHATTDEAIAAIGTDGIDLERTGQNWDDYSSAGPGLYTSKESRTALWYGAQAVHKMPGSQLQMLAIFQLPADVMPLRMSLDDYATLSADAKRSVYEVGQEHKYGAEFAELAITKAGLGSRQIEYVAVPLPKLPLPKLDVPDAATDRIESALNQFVRAMENKGAAGANLAASYAIGDRTDSGDHE
jgi:hypothetical protein